VIKELHSLLNTYSILVTDIQRQKEKEKGKKGDGRHEKNKKINRLCD